MEDRFYQKAISFCGLRNLVLIMLFGFLGLRLGSIISLDIDDIDIEAGLVLVKEKGGLIRNVALPKILCEILEHYIDKLGKLEGPLFLSKRNKRISDRTVQDIFRNTANSLGIEKHLHAHLFRHYGERYKMVSD